MGVSLSCDDGDHAHCLRPSCTCGCHNLSYGRRHLTTPTTTPAPPKESQTLTRNCTRCGQRFDQQTRQGRPFALCMSCRAR